MVLAIQRTSRFHGGQFHAPLSEEENMRLEFSDADLRVIAELMTHRRRSVELVAHRLNIEPDAVSPQLLKIMIFLHEVGHAHDYLHRFLQPRMEAGSKRAKTEATAALQERNSKEIDSLPLKIAPSTLAQWVAIPVIFWDHVKHFAPSPEVFASLRKQQPQEIVREQEERYKSLEFERIADTFATDFILRNRLLEQIK
ncbi:MAG: hypothetical protein PHE68_03455 [Candidatus Peribacteraceae bacterium]|nr:hypothetical protein [Candidatus Peribacteraceae bacterium]